MSDRRQFLKLTETPALSNPEQAREVAPGPRATSSSGVPAQRGDLPGHLHHERRLVALAPVRRRGQERRVGLHEQPVEGDLAGHLLDDLGAGEGHDAGEGEVEPQGEGPLGQLVAAREAVDDTSDLAGAFFLQEGRRLLVGLPGVDDDRAGPTSRASRTCRRKTSRCTSRGEWS